MNRAFIVGVVIGVLAAIAVVPRYAEAARPPPGVLPTFLNGQATQIGIFITDGGYSVTPVKVDGGTLTLTGGAVVRVRCPASACIGSGPTTRCSGVSLNENEGELIAANTAFNVVLKDTSPTISLFSPGGPNTCPFYEVR